jgi:hypothetical protein
MVYGIAACPCSHSDSLNGTADRPRCGPCSCCKRAGAKSTCGEVQMSAMAYLCECCAKGCAFTLVKIYCRKYDDSKVLTPQQRDDLFSSIDSDPNLSYNVYSMPAAYISANMLANLRISLNEMAAQATMKLIQVSTSGMNCLGKELIRSSCICNAPKIAHLLSRRVNVASSAGIFRPRNANHFSVALSPSAPMQ